MVLDSRGVFTLAFAEPTAGTGKRDFYPGSTQDRGPSHPRSVSSRNTKEKRPLVVGTFYGRIMWICFCFIYNNDVSINVSIYLP